MRLLGDIVCDDDRVTFEQFKMLVDRECVRQGGLGYDDLPDAILLSEVYDERMTLKVAQATARLAAKRIIKRCKDELF